jgi:hypothetical protein
MRRMRGALGSRAPAGAHTGDTGDAGQGDGCFLWDFIVIQWDFIMHL